MSRLWIGAATVTMFAAAVWACGDDTDGEDGTSADAGVDAGSYAAPAPPQPLACATVGTFDPCAAAVDPTIFVPETDGGSDAGVGDAAPLVDAATPEAGTCIASGAVRIACAADAGMPRFDLAAGDNGSSFAVAFSPNAASRFTIGAAGSISPMKALPSGFDDVRIVNNGGTIATVHASEGSSNLLVLRDNVPKDTGDSDVRSKTEREAPALRGVVADGQGAVYTLIDADSLNFQTLRSDQQAFDAKLVSTGGSMMGWSPKGGVILLASEAAGFGLYRDGPQNEERFPAEGDAFAVGGGPAGEPLVALTGPDEDELAIMAQTSPGGDFIRWRIRREPHCGLDSGSDVCGQVCTEKIRTAVGPTGSFVVTSDGESYFVYAEAHLTRTRTYAIDHDPVCDLLGGCACASTTTLASVDGLDIVALAIDVGGRTIRERARAHVELAAPETALFARHDNEDRDVAATASGMQIHVALQGGLGEMARIVLDSAK